MKTMTNNQFHWATFRNIFTPNSTTTSIYTDNLISRVVYFTVFLVADLNQQLQLHAHLSV
jgi:hypothetical protein